MKQRLLLFFITAIFASLIAPATALADEVERTLEGTAYYEDTKGAVIPCTGSFMFFVYDKDLTSVGGGTFKGDGSLVTLPFNAGDGTYYLVLLDSDGRALPNYAWYEFEIQSPATNLESFAFKRVDTVTLIINKNDALWTDNTLSNSLSLQNIKGGYPARKTTDTGSPVHFYDVNDGIYDLFVDSQNTGIRVTVEGTSTPYNSKTPTLQPQTIQLDYYSIVYTIAYAGAASDANIRATYDTNPLPSGSVVLGGKDLVITVTPSDVQNYTYAWQGKGASKLTTPSITLPSLASEVDVSCTIGLEEDAGSTPTQPTHTDKLPKTGDIATPVLCMLLLVTGLFGLSSRVRARGL